MPTKATRNLRSVAARRLAKEDRALLPHGVAEYLRHEFVQFQTGSNVTGRRQFLGVEFRAELVEGRLCHLAVCAGHRLVLKREEQQLGRIPIRPFSGKENADATERMKEE